ncbi:MAG: Fe-S cluster assembly sulfur transfer protein SufU [Bacteroidota bacterium]
MKEELKKLYQRVILVHSREPVRFEKQMDAPHHLKAYNPVCGDKFELFFSVEDGCLHNVSFHGYGCAISKASTSVLVKHLEGKPVAEAKQLCQQFLTLVQPEGEDGPLTDADFVAFTAARDFPGRLTCATLAWEELADWFEA